MAHGPIKEIAAAAAFVILALASLSSDASTPPGCANAFTTIQVDQLKLNDSGRIQVFTDSESDSQFTAHFETKLLAPVASAYFLCDSRLLATAVMHRGLKPFSRLVVSNTIPRSRAGDLRNRLFGHPQPSEQTIKIDGGAGKLHFRNGSLEVHDNQLRRLPHAEVPTGWEKRYSIGNGRPGIGDANQVNGELVFTATYWRRFNVDRRVFDRSVPVSSSCSGPIRSTSRTFMFCSSNIYEFNFDDGSRRLLMAADQLRNWTELPDSGGGYSGPWAVGDFLVGAYHHQPRSGLEEPAGLIQLVEASNGQPGRQEFAAAVPSRKIRHAQVIRDRLLLIAPAQKAAWLYNPATRSFSPPMQLPLSDQAQEITAISYTRDHVLIAEAMPDINGWPQSRLLVLNANYQLVQTIDLRGRTHSITSTARPWPTALGTDSMRLVRRP